MPGQGVRPGAVYFTEPDFFERHGERLAENPEVYMGVRSFPDGTFWLHWLHAPKIGTLEMPRLRGI